jgi:hypothetical protein
MARVVPISVVPTQGPVAADSLLPIADESRRSLRRQSTAPRFQRMAQSAQALSFVFRPFRRPRTRHSVLATLLVCTVLQLLVSVPYGANERAANGSALHTALRGLIIGLMAYFILGPIFLVTAPTLVRGGFHPRCLLSFPITLGVSIGVVFIPVGGSTLGIVSSVSLVLGLTFLLCLLVLNAPFFATDEHMALDQNFGPPVFVIGVLFFGMSAAYVTLSQLYSSALIGLLLPVSSTMVRMLAIYALRRCCHTFYYAPKQEFLTQLATSAQSQANAVPPILGDIEAVFGYCAAFFALIIGNAASVSTLVEVVLSPTSTAWLLSLAVSALQEVLKRKGLAQRAELWVAARLAAQFGLQWPTRMAGSNALKLVYLRSLGGTGYVAWTMALCIGCVRAVTFGDPAAIVWLDVSPKVWRVLVAQLAFGVMADVTVWVVERKGLQRFEQSTRFAVGHPLQNTAFRDLDLSGYAFVFGLGGTFIYGAFVAFLGPAFVTGACRDFMPNATHVWVQRALGCAVVNATVQPRLYSCAMVTQITLNTEPPGSIPASDTLRKSCVGRRCQMAHTSAVATDPVVLGLL